MRITARFLAICGMLFGHTQAAETNLPHVQFEHKDWEIACDNTRTCRAAGYQTEEIGASASVMLTRAAGPNQAVTTEVQLAQSEDDNKLPGMLQMFVGKQALGAIRLDREKRLGTLSAAQTAALLAALTKNTVIEWRAGKASWTISNMGANAVLLKMDEFQGRIGTPQALVRKGDKPETSVLPALPQPVVHSVKPKDGTKEITFTAGEHAALLAALRQSDKPNDCEKLHQGAPDLNAYPLSSQTMLVSTTCWMGAYNTGEGYWITNRRAPYAPRFVTDEANEYHDGGLAAFQKGRGIADCISYKTWTWDGKDFILTSVSTTGMCRQFAPGGAWDFPTLVSEVRPAR